MKCDDAELYMMKYMDGEMTPTEAEALNMHMRECAACQEAFLLYETIGQELSMLPEVFAPEGFEACVMAKIQAEGVLVTYSISDKIKGALWGTFTVLFGTGTVLVLFREPIMASLRENPFFREYINRLLPVADSVSLHAQEAYEMMSGTVASLNGALANATGVLFFLLALVCGVQVYMLQRRKHMGKAGKK